MIFQFLSIHVAKGKHGKCQTIGTIVQFLLDKQIVISSFQQLYQCLNINFFR